MAKYLAENGVSRTFKKTIGSIHFIPGIRPYGSVSWSLYIFVFLASFSALWWPVIRPKMGFLELIEKTIGSFHLIPGIYPYGVSLLTLYTFVFLASFWALWWPNIWPKIGFLGLFEKNIGSIHLIPVIYPYEVSLLTPIHFRVPSFNFVSLVDEVGSDQGVYCPHLWAQLVCNCFGVKLTLS